MPTTTDMAAAAPPQAVDAPTTPGTQNSPIAAPKAVDNTIAPPSVLSSSGARDTVNNTKEFIDEKALQAQTAKEEANYAAQVKGQQTSFGQTATGKVIKATDPLVQAEMNYWASKGTFITPDVAIGNVINNQNKSGTNQGGPGDQNGGQSGQDAAKGSDSQAKKGGLAGNDPNNSYITGGWRDEQGSFHTGINPLDEKPGTQAGGQYNPKTGLIEPMTEMAQGLSAISAHNDADHLAFQKQMDDIASGAYSSPEFKEQIAGIKSSFDIAKRAQDIANENAQTRLRQFGYTSSLSLISPSRFQSILSQAAEEGVQKLSDIAAKETQAIAEATLNFKKENYQVAVMKKEEADRYSAQKMDIAKTLYQAGQDAIVNAREESKAERQASMDALTIAKSKVEISQGLQTIEQKTADSIAPGLLAGDMSPESIQKAASDNGVSVDVLNGAIVKQYQEKKKQDILNSVQTANILGNTKVGGTVNIPGFGDIQVVGQGQNLSTLETKDGSIYTFDKATGKTVDTGLKAKDMSLDNILKIAGLFKDNPDLMAGILRGAGINVPTTGTGEGSVSFRTNNPGNIKWGDFAKSMGATDSGIQATDGGTFALFPSEASGTAAQKSLLTGKSYSGLTVDAAMKRWSNNGYGGEIVPELKDRKMSSLNDSELSTLMSTMRTREGWSAPAEDKGMKGALNIMNPNSGAKLSDYKQGAEREKVSIALNKLKDEAIAQGDIYGILKASAGGKDMGETAKNQYVKAKNALDLVGDLSEASKTVGQTGPITSLWRSNDPYDAKAAELKARLTALVPTVARGIYGEVGVLTDNDIKLYTQTLPNLSSTPDIRKALLGMTTKSIQRSIENLIKSEGELGTDVSGLQRSLREITDKSNRLLKESGLIPPLAIEIGKDWVTFPDQASYDKAKKELNLP